MTEAGFSAQVGFGMAGVVVVEGGFAVVEDLLEMFMY